jgi:kynureninase
MAAAGVCNTALRRLPPVNDPASVHRHRFPILDTCSYLVSHSLGAMPVEAKAGLERYAEQWASRGVLAWEEGWWEAPLRVGDRLAPLVGAPSGSIAMVPNVTIAEAVIASCLDLRPPNGRVVIADLDFPTVGYVWHSVPGAEVRTVRSWDGISLPTETVLQAIDNRVAVVLLSHVLFRSGVLLDVAEITRAAHDAGAMVVLDCYQSAGTIPLSLTELEVDAAVGGSVKWLCGGPGAGWLYIRPDLQDSLVPRFAGWQADEEPFAFRPGPLQPAAGMWRFLSGTPNVPALAAAEAAYGVIEEVGIEQIRRHSLWATQWLIDLADELEIPLRSERRPERRGGTVTLGVEDEEKVAQRLIERRVIVDSRPGAGVRVGPHFYTTRDDLEQFRAALTEIL